MAEFHLVDQAALDLVDGWPLDQVPHADYPHEPGRLYDCLRCSVECFCTGQPGHTECVFCATLREENNSNCPWCRVPDSEDIDDPETLCEAHEAEHEGLSVEGLRHRNAEWAAEQRDIYN